MTVLVYFRYKFVYTVHDLTAQKYIPFNRVDKNTVLSMKPLTTSYLNWPRVYYIHNTRIEM